MSNAFIRKDQVLEFLIEIGNEQQDNTEGNEGKDAMQRIEIRKVVEKNFGDGEAEHHDRNQPDVEAAPVNADHHQQHGIEKPRAGNAELLKVAQVFHDR